MESEVTVVVISCNRLDLLMRTIQSFNAMNTYPIAEFIIIDDSGNAQAHRQICEWFPSYTKIFNGENMGLIDSIDRVYSAVRTKYVFHIEDDWEFIKPGFIEQTVQVIINSQMVMQVWVSNVNNQPEDPEINYAWKTPYKYASLDGVHHLWHGFTFHPSLRCMKSYKEAAPWSQWSPPTDFLALRECRIGEEYYRRGYRAATLMDSYCIHTGGQASTWNIGQK